LLRITTPPQPSSGASTAESDRHETRPDDVREKTVQGSPRIRLRYERQPCGYTPAISTKGAGCDETPAGIVVSVPKVTGGMLKMATVYRANILGGGAGASTVVLSGGFTSKDIDRLAGEVSGSRQPVLRDERPLSSNMVRTGGEAWKVLEHVARRLRGNPSGN
jgi:hypothetical protein